MVRGKLDREQELANEPTKGVTVVTGVVGSSDMYVEGLVVSALVDTGSQSTNI